MRYIIYAIRNTYRNEIEANPKLNYLIKELEKETESACSCGDVEYVLKEIDNILTLQDQTEEK